MNFRRITAFILSILLLSQAFVSGEDMDKELATLAEKLAMAIKDAGKKKIAALDFTDLQGDSSELGRYVAEQLTVNMVMAKRDFAVLDRANLKRILSEHKLTASGLVDPVNAKKLGQFSGVDALILGTIVPKGQKMALTAKVITTDTAEIVGAAKSEFPSDETVQQLLSQVAKAESSAPDSDDTRSKSKISKTFSDLTVTLESIKGMQDGKVLVNFLFQNKNTKKAIGVAVYAYDSWGSSSSLRSSLIGGDGTECTSHSDDLTGLKALRTKPSQLTIIQPGREINVSLKYSPNRRFSENLASARLQAELVVNHDYNESHYANYRTDKDVLPPHCQVENLVLDIQLNKKK